LLKYGYESEHDHNEPGKIMHSSPLAGASARSVSCQHCGWLPSRPETKNKRTTRVTRFVKATMALSIGLGAMTAACSPAAINQVGEAFESPKGQLFCKIQLDGGGTLVAGLVDAAATAAAPGASPLVVVATGQTKAFVDEACAKAALQVAHGVTGVPVPPPTVQQVLVTPPPNQITAPVPVASATPPA
jgi:hypothetical protein